MHAMHGKQSFRCLACHRQGSMHISVTTASNGNAGASALPYDLGPIDIGKARRTGQTVSPVEDSNGFPRAEFAPGMDRPGSSNGATAAAAASMQASGSGASSSAEQEGHDVSFNNQLFKT